MNLSQLIAVCRERLDDLVEPYLVSDQQFVLYANRAQNEACERALCLFDLIEMDIDAETTDVCLDPAVLAVSSVEFNGARLFHLSAHSADSYSSLKSSFLFPTFYRLIQKTLYFLPPPRETGLLSLYVYRYPYDPMSSLDDEPEIPEYQQIYLTHWMCWEASLLTAVEQQQKPYDAELAKRELSAFEQRFGAARSALEMQSWIELPIDTRAKKREFL